PSLGPPVPADERVTFSEKVRALRHLFMPALLVFAVLGCIIGGITSPSEASAIGAAGSLLIVLVRRQLTWELLRYVLYSTTLLISMLIWIAIAAVFFSRVYTGLGAGMIINEFIEDFMLSPSLVIVMMLVSFFVLGMFLDDFAITFITVPIYVPILQSLCFYTILFAVFFFLSIHTYYIYPPFVFKLFYMRLVASMTMLVTD